MGVHWMGSAHIKAVPGARGVLRLINPSYDIDCADSRFAAGAVTASGCSTSRSPAPWRSLRAPASDKQHTRAITKVSFINMESDGNEPDAGSWWALHECSDAPRIRPNREGERPDTTAPTHLAPRMMMAQVRNRRQQCHRLHHLPVQLQGQPHEAECKLKEAHSG